MKKILERFDVLSDAIIAIIMTILVLEISAPETVEQLPAFLKEVSLYLISFILLINIWYRRTKITIRHDKNKSESFLLDVAAHGLMSLFPLAIKMLAAFEIAWVAVLFFGVLNMLVMSILNLIPIVEVGQDFQRDELSGMVHAFYHRRLNLTILFNLIIIAVALLLGRWGVYLYLFIPLGDFFSNYSRDKRLDQALSSPEGLKEMVRQRFR